MKALLLHCSNERCAVFHVVKNDKFFSRSPVFCARCGSSMTANVTEMADPIHAFFKSVLALPRALYVHIAFSLASYKLRHLMEEADGKP